MIDHTKKPHFSPTQLDMLSRCGEQYRRRYVEGEVVPPGIALLVGGGLHGGAEVNFRQKMDTREDLPAADIVDAAVEAFKTRAAGGYVLTDEEAGRGAGSVFGEATDMVARLAAVHASNQAPDYQPIAVEEGSRLVLPSASHDLVGVIDLVDETHTVVDLKTAARAPALGDVANSVQLTVYAAFHRAKYGELPARVTLDVLTKTKEPKRVRLDGVRGPGSMAALANRLNAAIKTIEAGAFLPAAPGDWVCSPKWCGYWHSCPYIDSERRAAAER
ncbi:MAG: PD-(D/E)XK nuclease family protein [Pirellulales bacterium]|nr:PD-(D/E)XK nuclease family protein [Pirellulales bacterium]